jgi:hypothetical protein
MQAWRAWPGTAGAITEVRLSSNSCNRVIRHRKPARRRVRDGSALHGLAQSAIDEAGGLRIYFLPAVEGSDVLWFAHAGPLHHLQVNHHPQ